MSFTMSAPKPEVLEGHADGLLVVVKDGADVSDRCFKCGEPSVKRLNRTLYWHAPGWYALLLVGPLIYVIFMLMVRRKCRVRVGLCDKHRSTRRLLMASGWITLLAGLGLIAGAIAAENTPGMQHLTAGLGIAGGVAILASIILAVSASQWITRPDRIEDDRAWLIGAKKGMLDQLPMYELPTIFGKKMPGRGEQAGT